jgi:Doubled CXXCH motif (Paired_CXXCH_1)
MKKLTMLLALGVTMVLMPSVSKATIIGTAHDFSSTGEYGPSKTNGVATFKWGGETNTYQNPCQVCHIPHKSQAYASAHAPLWNHKLSANTYQTYDQAGSASFNALGLSVTLGSSVACLSCHDGSVAINQTAGYTGTATNALNGAAMFAPSFAIEAIGGTDLTKMHPIGVSYSAALAVDSTLQPVTGTVMPKMLKGTAQNVECASCHDIHQTIGASATVSHDLIVDLNGGQLCLTCHNK